MQSMIVTVNGEPRTLEEGTSIDSLIDDLGLGDRRVAVEVNCNVVARTLYADHALSAGDVVEIVQFVGGG